jgi:hypothetical protein
MTYMTADISRAWVHQSGGLKAKAVRLSSATISDAWLDIFTLVEGKLIMTIFMPYEAALAYASAINTCNDREAVNADENANANG